MISGTTNKGSNFQFIIKSSAFSKARLFSCRSLGLTSRTTNFSTRNDNSRGSSVIANRNVKPVRLNSIILSSEHDTNIVSMRVRGVEISIVTNLSRKVKDDLISVGYNNLSLKFFVSIKNRTDFQELLDDMSDFSPVRTSQSHESIESFTLKDLFSQFGEEFSI